MSASAGRRETPTPSLAPSRRPQDWLDVNSRETGWCQRRSEACRGVVRATGKCS